MEFVDVEENLAILTVEVAANLVMINEWQG
jgi:hypothetical protein